MIFVEVFFTEESVQLVQFPPDFFHFISFGVRAEGEEEGRAAGGIMIFLRSSVFEGPSCKVISSSLTHLAVHLKPKHSAPFAVIGVYRTANEDSPVYDSNFFPNVNNVCTTIVNSGLPLIVAGDFNAKIGCAEGAFGEVDEFVDLLPLATESSDCNDAGAEMLGIFSELDFHRLPFAEDGVEKLTFVLLPTEDQPNRTGGSIVDHVFFTPNLVSRLSHTSIHLRPESAHCLLGWELLVDGVVERECPPVFDSTFLTFDVDKVLDLHLSEDFLRLATDPQSFTVSSAYSTIIEFIHSVTRRVSTSGRKERLSHELRELLATTRRVERLWRKDPYSDEGKIRGLELTRLARLFREKRDLERRQEAEEVRKKFWKAHYSGEMFKAWRIAKSGISGKGGGIRTSATQGISKEDWERHFSSILGGHGQSTLSQVRISPITVPELDCSFTLEEVRVALEKKRNHKAPGPDGLRIDFLRLFRYDDTVCQALANFFSLVATYKEIPSDWEKAYLFILYKGKGEKTSPDSFRGITLKSHVLKLFESLLQFRLVRWMEKKNLLPAEQLAYRTGMSGVDHVFTLNVLREVAVAAKGAFYVALIDLRKAFPSVNRSSLLNDLTDAGVSGKMVSMLRRLYVSDTFQLLLDGTPGTAVFVVVSGVHEGSCLSPLLFIFFIRDLPRQVNSTVGIEAPQISGKARSSLVYADDVAEMSYTINGLQIEIEACYCFFEGKLLAVNPDKSDVIKFVRCRSTDTACSVDFRGTRKEGVEVARYLGVFFDNKGSWKCQKTVALSRSKMALGRCKVILGTIGQENVKHSLNMFDVLVASVYRYGLGAWGPVAGQLKAFDDLFVGFVRWLFKLPKSTSKLNILSCFGRRCCLCDSLFLAAIQIAGAETSRNELWKDLIQDLSSSRKKSKWFTKMKEELRDRGIQTKVFSDGAQVVATRKEVGVLFAQFCFHRHLNKLTNTSADDFRRVKPSGIFPFLLSTPPALSRFLFSFILCNWRWIDQGKCKDYPRFCPRCHCEATAWHLLFECHIFNVERQGFERTTGLTFDFESLLVHDHNVIKAATELGRAIFNHIVCLCR
jgi:hypothetical protein